MKKQRTHMKRAWFVVALALIAVLVAWLLAQGVQAAARMIVAPFTSSGEPPSFGDEAPDDGATGEVLPGERLTVFAVDHPALSGLDPDLLVAVQRAAEDAALEDIEFFVNAGWRSVALQEELINDAVATYGSREEALRWVAPAETSSHVLGRAIDLGEFDATYWLRYEGWAYGLCQTYSNESWHFELVPEAVTEGCPDPYPDPTYDPRL